MSEQATRLGALGLLSVTMTVLTNTVSILPSILIAPTIALPVMKMELHSKIHIWVCLIHYIFTSQNISNYNKALYISCLHLGYSLSSGAFYGDNQTYVISGAPRYQAKGIVSIMLNADGKSVNDKIKFSLYVLWG